MNRKERRALINNLGGKKGTTRKAGPQSAPPVDLKELHEAALLHRKKGELLAAQTMCRAILARDPQHVGALILMGGISQEQRRNSAAIKFLSQALALDDASASAHDNLALTYQALGRHDDALAHFSRAIALGLGNIEPMVKQIPAVSQAMNRRAAEWPRQLSLIEMFGFDGLAAIAAEGLLLALLQCRVACDIELERFFIATRAALLQALASGKRDSLDDGMRFFRGLALQCFLNEYIYPVSDAEREQVARLRQRLAVQLVSDRDIDPLDLLAVAMYEPMHAFPDAATLLDRSWPEIMAPVLAQQISEPLEEASDREGIPVLTGSEDAGSLENEKQYDENPYPRWSTQAPARPTSLADYLHEKLGTGPRHYS